MEMNGMMETAKSQSYWWWFDSHNNTPAHSQWLHSTLSELDERTKSMLRIIEEDADSFAQRAEMYYKKRPQLISLVEDFYRTHRSLAIQFDHLRHDPSTRRTSPLVRSFSLSTGQSEKPIDLHKSYDACFTKSAYDSEDFLSLPSSKGSLEKPFGGRYAEMAYDSEESIDSEVDDPVQELNYQGLDYEGEESSTTEVEHADLMVEIDRLTEETMNQKKQLMEKERVMEELRRKLYETSNEVTELKEETERLRVENVEMYHMKTKDAEDKETMRMNLLEEKEELIAEKDEEKREVIRQMGVAIDMLKSENLLLKKVIANSTKKWNPFEFQALKGFRKLINCSTKPYSVVVPQ